MSSPRPRYAVALALVAVQLLGAVHLAFGEHALADGGAVVEVGPREASAHDAHDGATWCAEPVLHPAGREEACAVLACKRAGALVSQARPPPRTRPAPQVAAPDRAPATHAVDVLAVAPKASPPRLS